MMDWTDRHCRAFHRVLTRRALLYTEMAVDKAIFQGDTSRLPGFEASEHPVAIQLRGSDPGDLDHPPTPAELFCSTDMHCNVRRSAHRLNTERSRS